MCLQSIAHEKKHTKETFVINQNINDDFLLNVQQKECTSNQRLVFDSNLFCVNECSESNSNVTFEDDTCKQDWCNLDTESNYPATVGTTCYVYDGGFELEQYAYYGVGCNVNVNCSNPTTCSDCMLFNISSNECLINAQNSNCEKVITVDEDAYPFSRCTYSNSWYTISNYVVTIPCSSNDCTQMIGSYSLRATASPTNDAINGIMLTNAVNTVGCISTPITNVIADGSKWYIEINGISNFRGHDFAVGIDSLSNIIENQTELKLPKNGSNVFKNEERNNEYSNDINQYMDQNAFEFSMIPGDRGMICTKNTYIDWRTDKFRESGNTEWHWHNNKRGNTFNLLLIVNVTGNEGKRLNVDVHKDCNYESFDANRCNNHGHLGGANFNLEYESQINFGNLSLYFKCKSKTASPIYIKEMSINPIPP